MVCVVHQHDKQTQRLPCTSVRRLLMQVDCLLPETTKDMDWQMRQMLYDLCQY